MKNLGYYYYRSYFNSLEFIISDIKCETKLNVNNRDLLNSNLKEYPEIHELPGSISFELETIYPGLLVGAGYTHEIGNQEDELKLGFYFDYTSGLPCIPGSSVKGVLRDACEKAEGNYILSILEEIASGNRTSDLTIKDLTKILLKKSENKNHLIKQGRKPYSDFVNNIFEGKNSKDENLSFKERVIFLDAFPFESGNDNNKFLGNDFITPHLDPLKNPTPIQFLKILPRVKFRFNFLLTDTLIKKEIKLELFRQILLDLGIGAKTNVGYGQFTKIKNEAEELQRKMVADFREKLRNSKGKGFRIKINK